MKYVFINILLHLQPAFYNIPALLSGRKAEGYIGTGVKILIAAVIGSMLLVFLYSLFGNIILAKLAQRMIGLINYKG